MKGKKGASAAAKRVVSAAETDAYWRAEMGKVKAQHAAEVDGLRAEISGLRASINTRARELSEAAISQSRRDLAAAVRDGEAAVREVRLRLGDAVGALPHDLGIPVSFWSAITDILGVEAGLALGEGMSRKSRRGAVARRGTDFDSHRMQRKPRGIRDGVGMDPNDR